MASKENTTSTKKAIKENIISIGLNGRWSVGEFNIFFESLNRLYRLIIELDSFDYAEVQLTDRGKGFSFYHDFVRINHSIYQPVSYSRYYVYPFPKPSTFSWFDEDDVFLTTYSLHVKKIIFASPGLSDFTGIGKFMEVLFDLLKYYFPNKQDKLKVNMMREDLISKQIDNLRKMNYDLGQLEKYEVLKNSAVYGLSNLKEEDKITTIKLLPNDGEER